MEKWDNKEELIKIKQKIRSVEANQEALEETLAKFDTEIRELINIANVNSEVVDKILEYLEEDNDVNKKPRRNIQKKDRTATGK